MYDIPGTNTEYGSEYGVSQQANSSHTVTQIYCSTRYDIQQFNVRGVTGATHSDEVLLEYILKLCQVQACTCTASCVAQQFKVHYRSFGL